MLACRDLHDRRGFVQEIPYIHQRYQASKAMQSNSMLKQTASEQAAPFQHQSLAACNLGNLPVVTECELAKHLCSVFCGVLHGSHPGGLLTAVVLQSCIVKSLHQCATTSGSLIVNAGHNQDVHKGLTSRKTAGKKLCTVQEICDTMICL